MLNMSLSVMLLLSIINIPLCEVSYLVNQLYYYSVKDRDEVDYTIIKRLFLFSLSVILFSGLVGLVFNIIQSNLLVYILGILICLSYIVHFIFIVKGIGSYICKYFTTKKLKSPAIM